MMRKKIVACVYLCLCILVACKNGNKEIPLPDFTRENINGRNLWERITKETNYRHYPMWPDHSGMQLGMSPHGRYHKVYINEKLLSAVPNQERVAPYGAMCIKANYSASNELLSIAGMVKVENYNPEYGDWYWVMFNPGGGIITEGKMQMCINCHAGSNNDYITIRKLDKPLKDGTGNKK